ncbi:PREDICTED: uncharacterized protein LOC105365478 [Ceratosolen solmsi marchali]|uniref:Uncharacterized protein LOC105365478 n=1 Tax=Ceratosolen solmsi marchali TaxID=326594 RepID=A0AAJ7DZC4_9HYME|nr:PREDICTED: uncharacterized protein LOC105365478 [Ceratosolen solmsi marchali]
MPFNVWFIIIFFFTGAKCTEFGMSSMPPTILTLQMIIDFAVEENWKQVIFFDCIGNNDCGRTYAIPLMNCFADHGIRTSIKSLSETTDLFQMFNVGLSRLGVVLLLDDIDLDSENNLFHKLTPHNKTTRPIVLGPYVSWLVVSTKWNTTQILNTVKDWPIGIDTDFSITMSFLTADVILDVLNQFANRTCRHLHSYTKTYDYERLRRSQSISPPEMTFVQEFNNTSKIIKVFFIASVYKIRTEGNESLELESWDFWNPSRRHIKKEKITNKMRTNLKLHIMNFGLRNVTRYYETNDDPTQIKNIDYASSVETLQELINLFMKCLNVSANITNYVTAQTSTTSEFVNAIINGDIDLGVAYFDVDLERQDMLSFSYPIVHYTRSIYFKPPQTSINIFLRPFSKKMLLCVLATLVLIISVMEIINYVTLFIHWKEDREHFGLGEATLWCISIMCMQGSPWTPRTRAGKTVLLGSLMFSLMTYNSYSGSITSILSVKTTAISNVSDFFDYDYVFGCSKMDDAYITTKEELRNFYVKALEKDQLRVSEQTGLEKSINGSYAYFVTETVARRILRKALMFQRCKINELQTKTPGVLALPISAVSPYKKVIDISILRLWQYGILPKLSLLIKPPLLNCEGVLKYNQARFMDVYGAFVILLAGVIGSIVIFFIERTWASRQSLKDIQMRITGKYEDTLRPPNDDVFDTTRRVDLRLSLKILSLDRSQGEARQSKDKNLLTNDEFGSKGIGSIKTRDFGGGDLTKPRIRIREVQFIRFPDKRPPLFPYCP